MIYSYVIGIFNVIGDVLFTFLFSLKDRVVYLYTYTNESSSNEK